MLGCTKPRKIRLFSLLRLSLIISIYLLTIIQISPSPPKKETDHFGLSLFFSERDLNLAGYPARASEQKRLSIVFAKRRSQSASEQSRASAGDSSRHATRVVGEADSNLSFSFFLWLRSRARSARCRQALRGTPRTSSPTGFGVNFIFCL